MRRIVLTAILVALVACTTLSGCTGCSDAERRSIEISRQADKFETPRRITVVNTRTDAILWQMTGTFSIQSSNGDIDIICAVGDGVYKKHFFHLNEWTTYVVEDLSNTDVKLYEYHLDMGGQRD